MSVGRLGIASLVVLLGASACGGASKPPPQPVEDPVRVELARAETAERARRHDVAREHYLRAIAAARDPQSSALARREFAETLATWGEIAEAIVQLEASLAAKPAASAWHDLGILRHHRGDVAGAVDALQHARELAPKDPRPRIALAALRWKSGDRAGAATEYRALLGLELPDKVRAKVEWALDELARP